MTIKRPTLGLSMIVKAWTPELETKLYALSPAIDVFYIQINGPERPTDLPHDLPIEISYYEWDNDFAAARNTALAQVKSDFIMWLDHDDEVIRPDLLPGIVTGMEARGVDVMYLPYNYDMTEAEEVIAFQYRERILRNNGRWTWLGRIHETLVPEEGYTPTADRLDGPAINHVKTDAEKEASRDRNHAILLEEYDSEPRDPRITEYLAISFFGRKDFNRAIDLFKEHIATSGSDEHKYFSWRKLAEAYSLKGDYQHAIRAEFEALNLMPHYPDAYFGLAQHYYETHQYQKAIEFLNQGVRKPRPKDLSVYDPTAFTYRPLMLGALSYLNLGKTKEAYDLAREVERLAPDYDLIQTYMPMFEKSYFEDEAIKRIKWLYSYYKDSGGDSVLLFSSLPRPLRYDDRLIAEIRDHMDPLSWGQKSVVFFCGQITENWGPEFLDKGIGGSEEAIIYLSRELAKLGWDITVYNDREQPYEDKVEGGPSVKYLPWTLFNPDDTFDVFVAWRNPEFAKNVTARLKLADIHDVIEPARVKAADYIDHFIFRSHWHQDIYIGTQRKPKSFNVIGNGIVTSQFAGHSGPRRPHSVGYFSSYDRGLHCLLQLWPKIRAAVPDATLDICYGWNGYLAVRGADEYYQKMSGLIKALKDHGVTEHGRLSHDDLAELMKTTQVWAYPTEFTETYCITAIKAQQAGMWPVSTNVAALSETVLHGDVVKTPTIYSNGFHQAQFVRAVVAALREDKTSMPIAGVDWADRAREWDEVMT